MTPAHAAGAVDVTVTNSVGNSTLVGAFTYGAPPTLTLVAPNSGPAAGGTTVSLSGANFTAGSVVTFGGVPGMITAQSATSITVTTPARAAGTVAVSVTTEFGTATFNNSFTYTP